MNDAINQYLKYIEFERKFSPHTVREYANDIQLFEHFILEKSNKNIDPLLASSTDVREWLLYLLNKKEKSSTIHRRISALKSFYKFQVRSARIDKNPATNVLLPRKSKQLPVFLDENQINQLIQNQSTQEDFATLRNHTIIQLLYLTGIRRSELISLKISDIELNRKYITVLGKRNKQRNIPLPDWFIGQLINYISIRKLES